VVAFAQPGPSTVSGFSFFAKGPQTVIPRLFFFRLLLWPSYFAGKEVKWGGDGPPRGNFLIVALNYHIFVSHSRN